MFRHIGPKDAVPRAGGESRRSLWLQPHEANRAMIDGLVILFSAVTCMLIAYRAMRLDAQRPWFGGDGGTPQAKEDAAEAPGQHWRARAQAGARR